MPYRILILPTSVIGGMVGVVQSIKAVTSPNVEIPGPGGK